MNKSVTWGVKAKLRNINICRTKKDQTVSFFYLPNTSLWLFDDGCRTLLPENNLHKSLF